MILVDTSVWIDHLHAADGRLVALLGDDEVGSHPLVLDELLALVDGHRLWGRGLSAVDAHLLGSVALVAGGVLWTRDKRVMAAAAAIGIASMA